MIGQRISHYKILDKLGEGGMGIVYKAQDLTLNRMVALKFLPDQVSATAEETARFVQEAQAAAALNHPNICTIYGVEEFEGTYFIAMEFVDGQTLQTKKSDLTLKRALAIGVQIADALGAAHDQGIVHRDIKPENIMLRKDGSVVVMDFGLAKLRGVARLTKESSTVGTAGYMSPEQILGQDVDQRSDIFALGVVLYEMVAGQPPFKGVHETALTYEIVNVDPSPISSLREDIPQELDAIILECLEKEKDERYQSAREVAKDLRKFTRSTEVRGSRAVQSAAIRLSAAPASGLPAPDVDREPARAAARGFTVNKAVLAAALVVLPILSAVIVWKLHPDPVKMVRKFQWIRENDYDVISPDGNKLAYSKANVLWIRSFDKLEPVEVRDANAIAAILWSPNSESVAYFTIADNNLHELRRVSWAGTGNTLIARTEANSYPRFWGSDDSILVSSWDNRGLNYLWKVAASGGDLKPVGGGDSTLFTIKGNLAHVEPLPDGNSMLLSVSLTPEGGRIYAQTKYSRSVIFDGSPGSTVGKAIYDRSGVILFAFSGRNASADLWALPFDASSLKADGSRFLFARNADNVSVSGTGTLLFDQGGDARGKHQLVVLSRSGQIIKVLPCVQSDFFSPALSPDGRFIANSGSESGMAFDLWLTDVKREAQFQLSYNIPEVYHPGWSPDGRQLVYQSGFSETPAMYIQSTDGISPPRLIVSAASGGGAEPCWSADGRYIVFSRITPGGEKPRRHIWFFETRPGGSSQQITETPFDEYHPCLSPDGGYLAFASEKSGRSEVYLTEFPKAVRLKQVSFEGGEFPQWVGNEIFYVTPSGSRLMSVRVKPGQEVQLETPRELFSGDSAGVELRWGLATIYNVSRDGKSILAKKFIPTAVSPSRLVMIENWREEFRRKQ